MQARVVHQYIWQQIVHPDALIEDQVDIEYLIILLLKDFLGRVPNLDQSEARKQWLD